MLNKRDSQGACAPLIYYKEISITGNDWFQWYKQYIEWLKTLPKESLRRLEIVGLTECYYLTYINPVKTLI